MRIILPVMLIFMLLVLVIPGYAMIESAHHFDNLFHIALSLLTFSVLCMAGAQALLLAVQERLLRGRPRGGFLHQLPPLEVMESLLFKMIIAGFVLLSVLLGTSFYFFHAVLWTNQWLIHKTMLVLLAWVIFAVLLLGRYLRGWRGRKAIYGTLWGVLLLVVVYFGSKLMLQRLLG